jgi:WD40 repeat protein
VMSPTGEPVKDYTEPAINGARFSHDGQRLIRWGNRDDVLVTDLETGETTQLHGHAGGVGEATESPDGRFLAVTTRSRETVIWNLTEPGPPALGNIFVSGHVEAAVPSDDGTTWQVTQLLAGVAGRGIRLSLDGSFERKTSGDFRHGPQLNPVTSPAGLVGGMGLDERGRIESLISGDVLLDLPAEQCVHPIAIDDLGELAVVGGERRASTSLLCRQTMRGAVVDIDTGEHLFEIPLPIYAAFGHPGTATADLVVINHDWNTVDVRRLPEGDLIDSMQVEVYRPFISEDGRWVAWGSATSGAFLVDLEAVAAGTPMEEAVVMNPQIESGVTNIVKAAGNYLAASYPRGVIRVWRIDTGELWLTLPETDHLGVTHLAFSADGRYLFYGDRGVIRRMPLDPEELASLARERSLRDFTFDQCERFLSGGADCTQYER